MVGFKGLVHDFFYSFVHKCERYIFLKLKSTSTLVVYGLKFSGNIGAHPAKDSTVDKGVGEVFYVASAVPVTCHAVSIIYYLVFGDSFKN